MRCWGNNPLAHRRRGKGTATARERRSAAVFRSVRGGDGIGTGSSARGRPPLPRRGCVARGSWGVLRLSAVRGCPRDAAGTGRPRAGRLSGREREGGREGGRQGGPRPRAGLPLPPVRSPRAPRLPGPRPAERHTNMYTHTRAHTHTTRFGDRLSKRKAFYFRCARKFIIFLFDRTRLLPQPPVRDAAPRSTVPRRRSSAPGKVLSLPGRGRAEGGGGGSGSGPSAHGHVRWQ